MSNFIERADPGDVLIFRFNPTIFLLIISVGAREGFSFISSHNGKLSFNSLIYEIGTFFPKNSWLKL